jgi:hypothetical protein
MVDYASAGVPSILDPLCISIHTGCRDHSRRNLPVHETRLVDPPPHRRAILLLAAEWIATTPVTLGEMARSVYEVSRSS